MNVQVLFFAGLRESTSVSELSLDLPDADANVETLVQALEARLGRLPLSGVRVAVNEEFVSFETILKDEDVVAFIPPVAGG